MPNTPNGIPYAVNVGGNTTPRYSEHWVDGANQSSGEIQVAMQDWDAFNIEFFGDAVWNPRSTGGYTLNRILPMTHPRYPWMIGQELELQDVKGVPNADAAGIGDYENASIVIATATYRAVLFQVLDDATAQGMPGKEMNRWVVKTRTSNTQSLTIRNSQLHWVDIPLPKGIFPGEGVMAYSWTTWLYEWNNVPAIDQTGELPVPLQVNLDGLRGKVNSSTFDGMAPGTALLHDPKVMRFRSARGKFQFKIEFPIEYQAAGWNNKYRGYNAAGANSPGFYPAEVVQNLEGGGIANFPLYQSADLNTLFQAF